MARAGDVKEAMKAFYAQEAADRDTDAWLEAGGSPRVPETPASHYFIDRKVGEALRLARLDRNTRVLEVGCSFGHMTFLLAPRFREVVAVDLSPDSIALARRRAAHYRVDNVRFEVADAERLSEIAPQRFDGAFAFSTLRFCPRPERVLVEMMNAVRPGGRVVVDVPNRLCPWYGALKSGLGIEPHIHDRLYTSSEIRQMMESAGLRNLAVRHILFTSKRVPAALLPLFRAADFVLERLPGVRSTSGIVMAAGSKVGDG